jgi:hypothetical protein
VKDFLYKASYGRMDRNIQIISDSVLGQVFPVVATGTHQPYNNAYMRDSCKLGKKMREACKNSSNSGIS